ncbi:MAG: glycine zipper 2TM domain-containing protein [Xanthomonadales bacterium]|nr:glycine zipper 2TM domain-containing protein [Xanthomonadales bacterium]
MNDNLQKLFAVFIMVTALPAWAGHYGYDNDHYDYAKVVDARPIFEVVRVPEERQVCQDRVVRRRVAEHRSAGPAIFGAILGGVIGNQLARGHGHGHGHHNDRAAATIAGATIGGMVGSEIQYAKYPARYYTETAPVCRLQTTWHEEKRIVAWDVTWKYHGKTYHSRMDEEPGERIPVRISVDPAYR